LGLSAAGSAAGGGGSSGQSGGFGLNGSSWSAGLGRRDAGAPRHGSGTGAARSAGGRLALKGPAGPLVVVYVGNLPPPTQLCAIVHQGLLRSGSAVDLRKSGSGKPGGLVVEANPDAIE
jgi:hypothetical protein